MPLRPWTSGFSSRPPARLPSLGARLAEQGHDARHARDLDLEDAPDRTIVERARRLAAIILTHDLDYGRLLAFSGEKSPSVIIFRGIANEPTVLFQVLQQHWHGLEEPIQTGAIVILEQEALRIRPLPIET